MDYSELGARNVVHVRGMVDTHCCLQMVLCVVRRHGFRLACCLGSITEDDGGAHAVGGLSSRYVVVDGEQQRIDSAGMVDGESELWRVAGVDSGGRLRL